MRLSKPDTGTLDRFHYYFNRLILPEDIIFQAYFQVPELIKLGGRYALLRNPGYLRHDRFDFMVLHDFFRAFIPIIHVCEGARLINNVNRLVRQPAVIDKLIGQLSGRPQRLFRVGYAMIFFVFTFYALQDPERFLVVGSDTSIFWNLRERAPSFSKYFRYSS